jgi:hypothetical protein
VSRPIPTPEARPVAESSKETATFDAVGLASDTLADSRVLPVVRESESWTCRSCRKPLPTPFPRLPEPANVHRGRFDVRGAFVEVQDTRIGRRIVMGLPGIAEPMVVERLRWWPGMKAAAGLAAVALGMAAAMIAWPLGSAALPWMGAFLGLGVVGTLAWIRWMLPPCESPERAAVAAAWRELVPRLEDHARLIAACRGSLEQGDPAERMKPLRLLVESTADRVPMSLADLQLLAVARVLQVMDSVRMGAESVSGIAGAFEPFFEVDLPAAYAEAVSECLLDSGLVKEGEKRRLRILMLATAFDSGLRPIDLPGLTAALPHLRSLLEPIDGEALNELFAVWRGLPPEAGEQTGRAATVFELAVQSPGIARKLLARWPDLLLRITLPEHLRKSIGEVVLTPRGLFLDDLLIEDDDSTFGIERSPTGSGWYIAVGQQKVAVDRKPQGKITEVLAAWLEYRKTKLLAAVAKAAGPPSPNLGELYRSMQAECPHCGALNPFVADGEGGVPS